MSWIALGLVGLGAGALGYSFYLWLQMRRPGPPQPAEFARKAVHQERWLAFALFGVGAAVLLATGIAAR